METLDQLRVCVGELMKVSPSELNASSLLNGVLSSSLGRARLDALLRARLGITNPGVYTVKTFGDLCQVFGAEVIGVSASVIRPQATSVFKMDRNDPGISVGVDIQSVTALPEAADYWECDFYQQHFTRQEIAYALLQSDPRETFAAIWCAKEALKKADNRWEMTDWREIETSHEPNGRPILSVGSERISCSVSLSHTDGFAAAIVVIAMMQPSLLQESKAVSSQQATPAPTTQGGGSHAPLILAIAAAVLSMVALAMVLFR